MFGGGVLLADPKPRCFYLNGTAASGKTTFAWSLAPDVATGFSHLHGLDKTSVIQTPEDDPIPVGAKSTSYPPSVDDKLLTPFFAREYRRLIGIPEEASVVYLLCDDYKDWMAAHHVEVEPTIRRIQNKLLEKYDVVMHDYPLLETMSSQDKVVCLSVHPDVMAVRAKTPAIWRTRSPFDRKKWTDIARAIVFYRGRLWKGNYESCILWWSDDRWISLEEGAQYEIDRLGPWYQQHNVLGSSTGSHLNGKRRWDVIRSHLPSELDGFRFLDIGANAGYNSFQAAQNGCTVTAVEVTERYLSQFDLVSIMGEFEPSVVSRIELVRQFVQLLPLSKRRWDTALLCCVHYHINRSGTKPYRQPKKDYGFPWLFPPLAVVLEDLAESTAQLLLVTNLPRITQDAGQPEADPENIRLMLEATGWVNISVHPGDADSRPLIKAYSRKFL